MPSKLSDSKPGEKLLSLYTLLMLRGNDLISLGEIASFLDCSKQTVLRLIDQLEASGYGKIEQPVIKDRKHYYRMYQPKNKCINIGINEISQLALCRNLLIKILPKGLSDLIGKSSLDDMSNSSKEDSVGIVYTKGFIDYAPHQKNYESLLQAIQKNKVCKITYRRKLPETRRTFCFAPMRLVIYRESIFFVGWEVTDSGKVKNIYDNALSLYLQRFVDVALTNRQSLGLPNPPTAQVGNGQGPFGTVFGDPFTVKVLFSPEASDYVYDRQWSSKQKIAVKDDGSLELSFDAQNKVEVISWILGFGRKVKVLEPDWLINDIKEEVSKVLNSYC